MNDSETILLDLQIKQKEMETTEQKKRNNNTLKMTFMSAKHVIQFAFRIDLIFI